MIKDDATIRIKRELREILKKKKMFERETYSDVIKREMNDPPALKLLKERMKAERSKPPGEVGFRATRKFLFPQQVKKGKKVKSVSEVMKGIDDAINQYA